MKKKEKVGLSSPWYSYFHEVQQLFKKDPEVKVTFDEDKKAVNIFVENSTKAEALSQLIPMEREFSGTTIRTNIIPANNFNKSLESLFQDAFALNPIFYGTQVVDGGYTNPLTYVIFEDWVAQYYNDNLGDPHGNVSTLYQNIAKDVFEVDGAHYCTRLIDD